MTNAFIQSPSGLVVPAPKPESPKRNRRPLEFDDDEQREEIKIALVVLFRALGLGCGGGILLPTAPSRDVREAYERIWRMLGEMALGECPEMEEYT